MQVIQVAKAELNCGGGWCGSWLFSIAADLPPYHKQHFSNLCLGMTQSVGLYPIPLKAASEFPSLNRLATHANPNSAAGMRPARVPRHHSNDSRDGALREQEPWSSVQITATRRELLPLDR